MFESLSDRLHDILKRLRGESRLTESNIADAMKEIRTALLEADVNFEVAKQFVDEVGRDCIGQEVISSVTPGQQVIKIVNDHLISLLGGEASDLNLKSTPAIVMLVGLHGSGKTTTVGKLAKKLKQDGKNVLMVAGDVYRPAAIDQLEIIGREIEVPVHSDRTSVNVSAIAANALEYARKNDIDVILIDTAGRLQIDENMVQELVRIRDTVHPDEILLVADAALGQEAVSVADTFHKALDLTGFILTKLDGDARGGAALSIRKVTGVPVKFAGTGEKMDAIEAFYPERMASRILGMGDIVTLVEKAAAEIDEKEALAMQAKLRKNRFDYNDFLTEIHQINKLGGIEGVLKFLPGGRQLAGALAGAKEQVNFKRMEAIIQSMTKEERENPELVTFNRRKRIARGAGVTVETVSALTNQFDNMRKMMKKSGIMSKLLGGGPAPDPATMGMPGMPMFGATGASNRKEQERKRKQAKAARKERAKQRRRKK